MKVSLGHPVIQTFSGVVRKCASMKRPQTSAAIGSTRKPQTPTPFRSVREESGVSSKSQSAMCSMTMKS